MSVEKAVLDLGCGLNPHEDATIIMDLDPSIKNLEGNYKKIVYDLNNIPYPFEDEQIEKIYAKQILEHLQIHSFDFFRECHRILEPNGLLILELPNAFHYRTRLRFLIGRYVQDTSFHPFHIKLLKPSYIRDHLTYLGFDVKTQKTTKLWHVLGLEQLLPDFFARSISIIARKRP